MGLSPEVVSSILVKGRRGSGREGKKEGRWEKRR